MASFFIYGIDAIEYITEAVAIGFEALDAAGEVMDAMAQGADLIEEGGEVVEDVNEGVELIEEGGETVVETTEEIQQILDTIANKYERPPGAFAGLRNEQLADYLYGISQTDEAYAQEMEQTLANFGRGGNLRRLAAINPRLAWRVVEYEERFFGSEVGRTLFPNGWSDVQAIARGGIDEMKARMPSTDEIIWKVGRTVARSIAEKHGLDPDGTWMEQAEAIGARLYIGADELFGMSAHSNPEGAFEPRWRQAGWAANPDKW